MSVSVQKQGLDLRGQELGKEASPRKAEIRQNRKSVGERPLDLADVGETDFQALAPDLVG